ncbi:tonB-dependent receptor [alpha proteobacterium Q-1]|nr:tonB-dependent receptor [alpha proteobacterium Q-1]
MSAAHINRLQLLLGTAFSTLSLGLGAGDAVAQAEPDIEEIVVSGKYIPDEKRATSEVSSLIDAEDFALSGDSDAAAALRRVTGLSLVGDGFVFVRGLGERYSKALLNGAELPSPQPLERVVPLDVFPAGFLESVLVQKTHSSQYPSEFGGGVVALRTKGLPDENFISFGVSSGFDLASSLDDGLSVEGSGFDISGVDTGGRQLPNILRDLPIGALNSLGGAELEAASESLPQNRYSIDSETNAPNVAVNFSLGQRYEIGDEAELGIIAAANYDSEFQNKFGIRRSVTVQGADGSLGFNEDFSPEVCERQEFEGGGDDCGFRSTEWEIKLNGLLTVGLKLNDNHSFKYDTLILRKTTREAAIEKGEAADDPGTLVADNRTEWVEEQLWMNLLSGEHFFSFFDNPVLQDTKIDWRMAYSEGRRTAPLRRTFRFEFTEFDQTFRLPTGASSNVSSFGALDDEVYDLGFNGRQSLTLWGRAVDLNFGMSYFDQQRTSVFRRFSFNLSGLGPLLDLRTQIPELIFAPENIGPGQIRLIESTRQSDVSDGSFENWQGFAGFDAQILDTVRLAAGVRVENSLQITETVFTPIPGSPISLPNGSPIETRLDNDSLLPSATLTWEFANNMQLRGAFSQTLGRPSLRELSSSTFLDPERDRDVIGNPFLGITEFDNYDVRWEWYFGNGEQITLGGFYKSLDNPIERTFVFLADEPVRTFINADSADLWGIELEVEKLIPLAQWFDGDFFQNRDFFFKGNATFIDAESRLDPDFANGAQTNLERRLTGQSKWLGNAQLGWQTLDLDERLAINVNYTGKRITDIGISGAPDLFEDPPVMVNLTYARDLEIFGGLWTFSFEADNLLGEDFRLVQGGLDVEAFRLGREISIGASVRF